MIWLIKSGAHFDENEIRQLRDWSYECDLRWKQNWALMSDHTKYDLWQKLDKTMTWSIV